MKLSGFSIDEILAKESSHRSKNETHLPAVIYTPHGYRLPPYCFSTYRRRCMSPYSTKSNTSPAPADDIDDDKVTRRPRTSITSCQREFLEEEFQKERYPTLVYIDTLSRRINLPQYVIKVWFQNRRAKYRKEGHRRKPKNDNANLDENITIDLTKDILSLPWNKNELTDQPTVKPCSQQYYHWSNSYSDEISPNDATEKCSCFQCREGTCYAKY
ncbi:homeobox protein ceh-8-like [Hydractinia symbiolongicarpus]|uniref:homeobox protein ceh-8-like n=1 Tax=Hydractinia symbiolongicarpus TaxID=13093 RepID=UPI0025517CF7|nr:homeobox protein ceh-8-like [Hydractinia symbiolongicarpus]